MLDFLRRCLSPFFRKGRDYFAGIPCGGRAAGRGRDIVYFFLKSAGRHHRLPGAAGLFSVLFIDIAILGITIYTIGSELDRKMTSLPAVRVATVPAITKEVHAKKKDLLIDDFSKAAVNGSGGNTLAFNNYGGWCRYAIVREGPENYLKLSYDVSSASSYAGYVSTLRDIDLSGYTGLSFLARGTTSEEVFKIGLSDGKKENRVSISQIAPRGLSSDWQAIIIPLKRFSSIKSGKKLNGDFYIIFEHSQGMPYVGTIYLKDIKFTRG